MLADCSMMLKIKENKMAHLARKKKPRKGIIQIPFASCLSLQHYERTYFLLLHLARTYCLPARSGH